VTEVERKRRRAEILRRSLVIIPATAIPFGLVFGLAFGDFWLSLGISTTISITLFLTYTSDYLLIQPRLAHIPREKRLIIEIAIAAVETVVGFLAAFVISSLLFGFPIQQPSIWISLLIGFGVFLVMRSIRYAVQFYRDLKARELMEERLRALTAQAELKALKAQINPHFLFNTLNTVASLTHSNPMRAEATIERLAEMFRYILVSSERGLVSLEEELTFVDGYLEIEQARFGERLKVHREIDGEAMNVPVPSLILQPLVENAVRHGQSENGDVTLMLRVDVHDDVLLIDIADEGPGMPPGFKMEEGMGIGFRNVDERLRKTYGDEYGLQTSNVEPQGAIVSLRIPTVQ
jgi:sensor histidine kinase YesM